MVKFYICIRLGIKIPDDIFCLKYDIIKPWCEGVWWLAYHWVIHVIMLYYSSLLFHFTWLEFLKSEPMTDDYLTSVYLLIHCMISQNGIIDSLSLYFSFFIISEYLITCYVAKLIVFLLITKYFVEIWYFFAIRRHLKTIKTHKSDLKCIFPYLLSLQWYNIFESIRECLKSKWRVWCLGRLFRTWGWLTFCFR